MSYNPLIPQARPGKGQSRNRRIGQWATTQSPNDYNTELYDTTGIGVSTTINSPSALGMSRLLQINTYTGGTILLMFDNDAIFNNSWVSQIMLSGTGAYVYMIAGKAYDQLRWIVISSAGAYAI